MRQVSRPSRLDVMTLEDAIERLDGKVAASVDD